MRTMATLFMLVCFSISLFAGVLEFCPGADDVPGWKFEFEPEVYTPENLHDYIDGEAELYKKYEFVDMATASYVSDKNSELDFTVDIYDMGTPLNAFGIYSIRRRPEMTFANIGEEATVSEMMVRFWKGRFYVQALGGAQDRVLTSAMTSTAKQIAKSLPAAPQPMELTLLPEKNQQPHTLTYFRDRSLNSIKCSRMLQANYESTAGNWVGFVLLFDDAEQAKEWLHFFEPQPDVLLKTIATRIFGVKNFTNQKAAANFLKHSAARAIQATERSNERKGYFRN